MVENADIKDRDSLEAWLQGQPKEVSVWIARRAALRVWPYYWEWTVTSDVAKKRDFTALPMLRFYLTSEVARKMPTSSIMAFVATSAISASDAVAAYGYAPSSPSPVAAAAADASSAAADACAYNSSSSAAYAADASSTAVTTVAADVWPSIRADCEVISTGADLDHLPLWVDGDNPLASEWQQLKQHLTASDPHRSDETARGPAAVDWSFWIRWYDSVLAGEPLNWEMLEEIALIEGEEWERGPLHINNEVIAWIVEEYDGIADQPIAALTPELALSRNAKVIRLQLDTLKLFIEEEIQNIRGANDITKAEGERIEARVSLLTGIVVSVDEMQAALADDVASPENALVVIESNLPKVIEAADDLEKLGQTEGVCETIVTMGASIAYLTKCGTPGYAATGIAALDMIKSTIGKWFKRSGSSKQ